MVIPGGTEGASPSGDGPWCARAAAVAIGARRPTLPEAVVDHPQQHLASAALLDHQVDLLADDLPSLAVKAFLVTYDFNLKSTEDSLRRFARSLCQNFAVLQGKGHPKWREVELSLPDLGRGWFYYPPTAKEIRSCIAARTSPRIQPTKPCTQEERILGLCG